jgi:broad specificity phosphatase PhoE
MCYLCRDNIDPDAIIDYAETPDQVHARHCLFLQTVCGAIMSRFAEGGGDSIPRVLAVSHGRFIRMFLNHFAQSSAVQIAPASIVSGSQLKSLDNCSITIVRVNLPPLHPSRPMLPEDSAPGGKEEGGARTCGDVEAMLVNWTSHLNDSFHISSYCLEGNNRHSERHLSPDGECSWLLMSSR